jgi:hypothetical protein
LSECLAVVSDTGSLFRYEYGCVEEIYQRWLNNEGLVLRSVRPNPAQGEIVIDVDADAMDLDVSIYDLLGRELIQASETKRLDVSKLPNGEYYLRVATPISSGTRKIVIFR